MTVDQDKRKHDSKSVQDEVAALWFRAPIKLTFELRANANYYRHQLYYARRQMPAHPELNNLGVFVYQQGEHWILEIKSKNTALLQALEEAGVPVGPPPLDEDLIP
jgi:hypothetical protein